jgi:hypothetical protein
MGRECYYETVGYGVAFQWNNTYAAAMNVGYLVAWKG